MASWTMQLSDDDETKAQDPVSVLIGAPIGASGFDEPGPDIDLTGYLCGADTRIALVGREHTGTATVERTLEVMPDVLVVDTRLHEVDTRTVCRRVHEWAPATRILAVAPIDNELLYTTIAAGATSALIAERVPTGLAGAAWRLALGESLLPARAAQRLLNDVDAWSARSSDPLYPPPTLTSTEREVLIHLGAGRSSEQIAETFGVTSHLVNLHTGFAVTKLHRYLTGAEYLASTVD